jgi:hypothetical protein
MRLEWSISQRGADRQMGRHDGPDRLHALGRRLPERAGAGVLDVDDLSAGAGGVGGLDQVGHADEESHAGYYSRTHCGGGVNKWWLRVTGGRHRAAMPPVPRLFA